MSDLAHLNECLKFKQMDIQSQTNINFPVLVPLQHIFRWSAKLFWGLFVINHELYGFSKLCTDSFKTCKIIFVSQTNNLHMVPTKWQIMNDYVLFLKFVLALMLSAYLNRKAISGTIFLKIQIGMYFHSLINKCQKKKQP